MYKLLYENSYIIRYDILVATIFGKTLARITIIINNS